MNERFWFTTERSAGAVDGGRECGGRLLGVGGEGEVLWVTQGSGGDEDGRRDHAHPCEEEAEEVIQEEESGVVLP